MAVSRNLSVARLLPAFPRLLLLLVALVATGCAPDGLTRTGAPDSEQPAGLFPSHVGDADLAAMIEADLTCLYDKAGLLPNESSSLGKFRQIQSLLAADDLAGALDATAKLIAFIELKYSQYANKSAVINCGPPTGSIGITELKERTVTRLNAYVNLTGSVCEIPAGAPATFCRTADNQTALVYFPPDLFSQLTYVSLEENPAGFTGLQNLGLDEYPNYVRIVTEPISDFSQELVKPLVVVCYNDAVLPNDQSLLARLLLGHQHTDENNVTSFKLLPRPDFNQYGQAVLDEVTAFCAGVSAPAPGLGFSPNSALGRFGNKLIDLFTPAPLQAAMYEEFRGVGGSAEEFSTFGAIDPGLDARGGVGGSAEEFAPPAGAAGGPAAATLSGDGTTVTGKAGVDVAVTDPAELPRVKVVSPGLAKTPIAGVVVHFELLDPDASGSDPISGPASEASLCGATSAVTDANGEASPACLNFGNTLGYRNLRVTFDPTGVDPLACILDTTGACATATTSVNFLVETIAGDPAKLALVNAPGSTTAQAGVAMTPQPILQVQDAGGNPVANLAADYPVAITVTKADGTPGGTLSAFTAATDRDLGQVTVSGLALGGTVGTSYRLSFTSGALTAATVDITVTAAGAPASLAVAPGTTSAQAGGLIPTLTATVLDGFGNGVAGVTVDASGTDLACFSASVTCKTGSTNGSGQVGFDNLTVEGPGTSRTLTFASAGLTSQTVTVTLTPGPAAAIAVDQPSGGNYGTGLPIGPVSPNPQVKVTDAWGNPVSGAGIVWQLASTLSGATVSATSTTSGTGGLSSVTWRLGDGDNGLTAYLGSTTGPSALFSAASITGGVSLTCAASGKTGKVDLGAFNAAAGTWTGYFSMQPELAARFRRMRVFMSVTGQSSGTGDYPAVLKVYRGSIAPANLLGTGAPATSGVIKLAGDNGSAQAVDFTISPNLAAAVAAASNTNKVIFELVVTAPATRTLQLWYNTRAPSGTCANAILYAPGVTNFGSTNPKDFVKGMLITVGN